MKVYITCAKKSTLQQHCCLMDKICRGKDLTLTERMRIRYKFLQRLILEGGLYGKGESDHLRKGRLTLYPEG
jgi:hypothetical protein